MLQGFVVQDLLGIPGFVVIPVFALLQCLTAFLDDQVVGFEEGLLGHGQGSWEGVWSVVDGQATRHVGFDQTQEITYSLVSEFFRGFADLAMEVWGGQ